MPASSEYTTIRFMRGSSDKITTQTPLEGEPLYDVEKNILYIGDGATPGGVVVGGLVVRDLVSGTDVNTFVDPGYFKTTNLINGPSELSSSDEVILINIQSEDENEIWQEVKVLSGTSASKVFTRISINGSVSWTEWSVSAVSMDIELDDPNLSAKGQGQIGEQPAKTGDLNDFKDPCNFFITITANGPTNITEGWLTVFKTNGNVKQLLYTAEGMYFREFVSSVWNTWFMVNPTDMSTGIMKVKTIVPDTTATYNLGSSSNVWNTVYATSTRSKYGDLAENYSCKTQLKVGDVVLISRESGYDVELSNEYASSRVLGVVSEAPGLLINCNDCENMYPIARVGKVKCNVRGLVKKGDLLISGYAGAAVAAPNFIDPCTIVGRANEDKTDELPALIEIII